MGRKERRIQKKFEKNPIRELNKVQNRFYSQLFWKFSQTEDPRHPSYITYTNRMMLGTLYYKGIAGIDSMQEMTEKFNDEAVSKNLSVFMGETAKEYVPHHVTVIRQIKCGFIYQIIYACFKNSDYRIAALFTAILSGYLMPRAITQIT